MKKRTKNKSALKKVDRRWYLFDADGKILGRLATKIANLLRGREKPDFNYHLDQGNFVVVINTDKIKVTGKKKEGKIYQWSSGYLGHLKKEKLGELLKRDSREVLKRAVFRMLPKNRLRSKMMPRLKIYKKEDYPYLNKKPIKYEG